MPLRPRHSARAHRSSFWRHWTLWIYFPLAVILVAGGVFLWKSGHWLVHEDEFGRSTWAAILAGEFRETERADAAFKLYLDGRIDTLVYSGVPLFKTRYSSEFLAEYLAGQGFPREKLFEFRQDGYSTLEEARMLVRQFRYHDMDTVVIVTVNYHTARARRIFRKVAQGYPHILVHPAESPLFVPSSWWSSREGRKHWLMEWTKTVAAWFELMGAAPETGKAESDGLIGILGISPGNSANMKLLESLAAEAERDSIRQADSLAAVRRDTVDNAEAVPGDTAGTAEGDTGEAGKQMEERSVAAPRPKDTVPARSSAKASEAPKTSAKPPVRTPAKKPAEKEKAKKKTSR